MASDTLKEAIQLSLEALRRAEPFPLSYLDSLSYDDPRLKDGHPDKDRITATMAKRFLIEHGIEFEESAIVSISEKAG